MHPIEVAFSKAQIVAAFAARLMLLFRCERLGREIS
jgi:hypothetical protein